MTQAELRAALKNGAFGDVFFFCGEEDYLKRYYLSEIRTALQSDETLAVFNHIQLEGETLDLIALEDAVSTPPFMADYKLIEWRLLVPDKMKEEDIAALEDISARVRESGDTCLVFTVQGDDFDVGRLPKKPSALYTRLDKALSLVYFAQSNDGDLVTWIARHLKKDGLVISAAAARAILLRCGHSMTVLSGEVDKLACLALARGRSEVTEEDVVGIVSPCEEFDAFALSNALLENKTETAYRCLRDLRLRRVEPLSVLGSLVRFYSELTLICRLRDEGMASAEIARTLKMHEYPLSLRLRALEGRTAEESVAALDALRRLDAASKESVADVYGGIERMIATLHS